MRRSTIALLAILTISCLLASTWMWRRAFPMARIDFKVSREEARLRLEQIIEKLGHPLAGYRSAIGFSEDDDTKHFLEIEHGLAELDRRSREGLNVWYWTARWFRPSQHEEFTAQLDPQGWLVGFSHVIEEEREAPSLEGPAARAVAEKFLREFAGHHAFERLAFLDESHEEKPKRTDWEFTWERPDLRFGAARYRIMVTVQGNEVGSYGESLDVPETWTRDFAKKRESNDFFQSLATFAAMPIGLGAFVLLILYVRQRKLDWRALPWGWLVLFAAVELAGQLNGLPGLFFSYVTTEKWSSFLWGTAFTALRAVLLEPVGFWVLVMVAHVAYRDFLPQHPSLRRALGTGALRDPQTVRAMGLGIVLAAVALAYVPGFYLVANRLGAWCPVEVDYTETLSGGFPWVAGVNAGLSAAFSEELIFRVLGAFLLTKVLRLRWLAVVLACTIWGFLHSNYEQMPGYLRGIELTAEGVLWGWVVLRFGVIATLTAHYLFNCTLGCAILFQSPSWVDRLGAGAAIAWPIALFAYGAWQHWRKRWPLAEEPAVEAPAYVSVTPATALTRRWDFTPRRFTARQRWAIAGVCIAVMLAIHLAPLPQDPVIALGNLDLGRAQIAERADAIVRERGFQPESWRRVITMNSGSAPMKYLLRYGSVEAIARLFGVEWADLRWYARYFRIGEREELGVTLDQHGRLLSWWHSILREAPGASLDRDAALALARTALPRERGVNLDCEKLVSESVTEQEKRRDHYFEFQRTDWKWGESELRTSATVQGDEVVGISRWVKVPEAFKREEAKSGWRDLIAREVSHWWNLAVGIVCVIVLILLMWKELVPWRRGFLLALFPLLLKVAGAVNDLPWFFSNYSTTTPLSHFLTKQILGGAAGFAFDYLLQVLFISIALGLAAWAFGWTPRGFAHAVAADPQPRRLWRDSVPLILAAIALFWVVNATKIVALSCWFPWRAAHFWAPNVNSALPWLDKLVQALSTGFDQTLSIIAKASFIALLLRRFPRLTIAALLLSPLTDALRADSWPAFAYQMGTGELELLLDFVLIVCVWRFNPIAIFASYAGSLLLSSILVLLEKGGPVYRWDGIILLVLTAAAIIAAWQYGRRIPKNYLPQPTPA